MIQKRINKPFELSTDAVFSIIELQLAKRYKIKRISDSRLAIKKLYKFKSAKGKEVVHKQMSFKDSGYFTVDKNSIIFKMNLNKQILFWMSLLIVCVLFTWKLWDITLFSSIIMIATPILLIWIVRIIKLKKFMNKELTQISKRFNN